MFHGGITAIGVHNFNEPKNYAIGEDTLSSCTVGDHNTAFGYHSLPNLVNGNYNVGLGTNLDTQKDHNVLIGHDNESLHNHCIVIGNHKQTSCDNEIIIGDVSIDNGIFQFQN